MGCHEAEVTHAVREEEEAEEAGPGAALSGFEFHRRRLGTRWVGAVRGTEPGWAKGSPGPVSPR